MPTLDLAAKVNTSATYDNTLIDIQRGNTEFSLKTGVGDEFGSGTQQDIKTGGDGAKLYGVNVINSANADAIDANITNAGKLTIDCNAAYTDWFGATASGPFVYWNITGNFIAECSFTDNGNESFEQSIMMVRDPGASAGEDWLMLRSQHEGVSTMLYYMNTVNSSSDSAYKVESSHSFFQIMRVGSAFYLSSKAASGDSWTLRRVITRSDFASTLQVGLAAATGNTGNNFVAQFDFFRWGYSSASPTIDPVFLVDSGVVGTTWDFANDDINELLGGEAGSVKYQWSVYDETGSWNGTWLTKAQLAAVPSQTGRYKAIKAQLISDGTQDVSLADSSFRATVQSGGGGVSKGRLINTGGF